MRDEHYSISQEMNKCTGIILIYTSRHTSITHQIQCTGNVTPLFMHPPIRFTKGFILKSANGQTYTITNDRHQRLEYMKRAFKSPKYISLVILTYLQQSQLYTEYRLLLHDAEYILKLHFLSVQICTTQAVQISLVMYDSRAYYRLCDPNTRELATTFTQGLFTQHSTFCFILTSMKKMAPKISTCLN